MEEDKGKETQTKASKGKGRHVSSEERTWRTYSKSLIEELKEKLAARRARTLGVLSEGGDLSAFCDVDTESDGLDDTSSCSHSHVSAHRDIRGTLQDMNWEHCADAASISETSSLSDMDFCQHLPEVSDPHRDALNEFFSNREKRRPLNCTTTAMECFSFSPPRSDNTTMTSAKFEFAERKELVSVAVSCDVLNHDPAVEVKICQDNEGLMKKCNASLELSTSPRCSAESSKHSDSNESLSFEDCYKNAVKDCDTLQAPNIPNLDYFFTSDKSPTRTKRSFLTEESCAENRTEAYNTGKGLTLTGNTLPEKQLAEHSCDIKKTEVIAKDSTTECNKEEEKVASEPVLPIIKKSLGEKSCEIPHVIHSLESDTIKTHHSVSESVIDPPDLFTFTPELHSREDGRGVLLLSSKERPTCELTNTLGGTLLSEQTYVVRPLTKNTSGAGDFVLCGNKLGQPDKLCNDLTLEADKLLSVELFLTTCKCALEEILRIIKTDDYFYSCVDKRTIAHIQELLPFSHGDQNVSSNSRHDDKDGKQTSDKPLSKASEIEHFKKSQCLQACLKKARLVSALQVNHDTAATKMGKVVTKQAYERAVREFESLVTRFATTHTNKGVVGESSSNAMKSESQPKVTTLPPFHSQRNALASRTFVCSSKAKQSNKETESANGTKVKRSNTFIVRGKANKSMNKSDNEETLVDIDNPSESGLQNETSTDIVKQTFPNTAPTTSVENASLSVESTMPVSHAEESDSESVESHESGFWSNQKYTSSLLTQLLDYSSQEEEDTIELVDDCKQFRRRGESAQGEVKTTEGSIDTAHMDVNTRKGEENAAYEEFKTSLEEVYERTKESNVILNNPHNKGEDTDGSSAKKSDKVELDAQCTAEERNESSRPLGNKSVDGYVSSPVRAIIPDEIEDPVLYGSDFETGSDSDTSVNTFGNINDILARAEHCMLESITEHHKEDDSKTRWDDEEALDSDSLDIQCHTNDKHRKGQILVPYMPQNNKALSPVKDTATKEIKDLSNSPQVPHSSKDSPPSTHSNESQDACHKTRTGNDTSFPKGQTSKPNSRPLLPRVDWSSSDEDSADDITSDMRPADILRLRQIEQVDGQLNHLKEIAKRKRKSRSPHKHGGSSKKDKDKARVHNSIPEDDDLNESRCSDKSKLREMLESICEKHTDEDSLQSSSNLHLSRLMDEDGKKSSTILLSTAQKYETQFEKTNDQEEGVTPDDPNTSWDSKVNTNDDEVKTFRVNTVTPDIVQSQESVNKAHGITGSDFAPPSGQEANVEITFSSPSETDTDEAKQAIKACKPLSDHEHKDTPEGWFSTEYMEEESHFSHVVNNYQSLEATVHEEKIDNDEEKQTEVHTDKQPVCEVDAALERHCIVKDASPNEQTDRTKVNKGDEISNETKNLTRTKFEAVSTYGFCGDICPKYSPADEVTPEDCFTEMSHVSLSPPRIIDTVASYNDPENLAIRVAGENQSTLGCFEEADVNVPQVILKSTSVINDCSPEMYTHLQREQKNVFTDEISGHEDVGLDKSQRRDDVDCNSDKTRVESVSIDNKNIGKGQINSCMAEENITHCHGKVYTDPQNDDVDRDANWRIIGTVNDFRDFLQQNKQSNIIGSNTYAVCNLEAWHEPTLPTCGVEPQTSPPILCCVPDKEVPSTQKETVGEGVLDKDDKSLQTDTDHPVNATDTFGTDARTRQESVHEDRKDTPSSVSQKLESQLSATIFQKLENIEQLLFRSIDAKQYIGFQGQTPCMTGFSREQRLPESSNIVDSPVGYTQDAEVPERSLQGPCLGSFARTAAPAPTSSERCLYNGSHSERKKDKPERTDVSCQATTEISTQACQCQAEQDVVDEKKENPYVENGAFQALEESVNALKNDITDIKSGIDTLHGEHATQLSRVSEVEDRLIASNNDMAEKTKEFQEKIQDKMTCLEENCMTKVAASAGQIKDDVLSGTRSSIEESLQCVVKEITTSVTQASQGINQDLESVKQAVVLQGQEASDVKASLESIKMQLDQLKKPEPKSNHQGMDVETMKMRIMELTAQRDSEKAFHKITRESLRALERDHERLRDEYFGARLRRERRTTEQDTRRNVRTFLSQQCPFTYSSNYHPVIQKRPDVSTAKRPGEHVKPDSNHLNASKQEADLDSKDVSSSEPPGVNNLYKTALTDSACCAKIPINEQCDRRENDKTDTT